MKSRFQKRFEALNRIEVFGQEQPAVFPEGSFAGESLNVIKDVVARLTEHDHSLLGGSDAIRKSKANKAEAYVQVLECLFTLSRMARGLRIDDFFMPEGRSYGTVLSVGKKWVKKAEQYREFFAKCSMPDIVERLKASVDWLQEAINGLGAGKGTRRMADSDIEKALAAGFEAVERLDPIMENALRNSSAMEYWLQARRVERPPRRRSADSGEKPAVAGEKPANTGDKPVVAGEQPVVAGEQPEDAVK